MRDRLGDERGQSWGLFLKLGMAAILVALIIVQIGPILSNQLEVRNIARDAASIGVNKYRLSKGDMDEVRKSIETALLEQGARLASEVSTYKDSSGNQVLSFTVRKITRTYLFYHVDFLAPYTEALASAEESFLY